MAKKAAAKKFYGTGRRKSSIARVYLTPGKGEITINKRSIDEYFGLETLKVIVRQPLTATNTVDKYDIMMLSMPPGVGKSTLGIFFLAWIIGRDPKKCNLAIGYSTPMAKSFFSRISSIDIDIEYTLHKIFPHLSRTYTSAKELELDFSNDPNDPKKPFVSLTCASVEGATYTSLPLLSRIRVTRTTSCCFPSSATVQ